MSLVIPDVERRARGAYFTPGDAARLMADWIVRTATDSVLEPTFGDGSFLSKLDERLRSLGSVDPDVYGVELDAASFRHAVDAGLLSERRATRGDFLSVSRFPVDAAIGNPPFVRLRSLTADQRERADRLTSAQLGQAMHGDGSLWMPIVLHAASFLKLGGRMAWVLPFEATHVRYAKPFWNFLVNHFGQVKVLRVRERIFPDILQDVVLLFAEDHGSRARHIEFEWYSETQALLASEPEGEAKIDPADIARDLRPFERALIGEALIQELDSRFPSIGSLAEVRIGYVAGDKAYFHPDASAIASFGLEQDSLVPTIATGRQLAASGVTTARAESSLLFRPGSEPSAADGAYIDHGVKAGVSERYKCRVRSPWYRVPLGQTPDVVATVFGDHPRFLINEGRFQVSNSLLSLTVRAGRVTPEQLVAGWYTSAARLSMLNNVHALGGGLLIMIPGEVSRIRVPLPIEAAHLPELDVLLRSGRVEEAYALGDRVVLEEQLGLPSSLVARLQSAVRTATSWRKRVSR